MMNGKELERRFHRLDEEIYLKEVRSEFRKITGRIQVEVFPLSYIDPVPFIVLGFP
jgi:hypothetical protein